MGKIVIAGIIGFASFFTGMAGLYFAFPAISPERTIRARHYVDSLMTAPGGQLIAQGIADWEAVRTDSAELSAPADSGDSARPIPTTPALASGPAVGAARDSIRALSQRIGLLTAENQALRKRIAEQEKAMSKPTAKAAPPARPPASAADVAALSTTLAKLGDRELRPILQQVDGGVLESLYRGSSGKTQARLLKAMSPEQAARFVQTIIRGAPAEAPAVKPATAAQPAGAR